MSISVAEVDGRLSALKAQRDQALDIVVIQSGQIAQLRSRVEELEKAALVEKDAQVQSS